MTAYRLFPATNGPASPVAYSGNFIAGVMFAVSGGGKWFNGYWWWVAATGQSTAPVKCALWEVTHVGVGTLVLGSVVTSGTLTAGQWNYIPLPQPIQLAASYDPANSTAGSGYVAAIGVNGSFPDTNGQFTAGGVYSAGIVNGPLAAYSDTGGTLAAPYGMPQGLFTTGGSDPSVTMPGGGSNSANFWVDVQVSDTEPSGYSGSYRLWPGKLDSNPSTTLDAAVAYSVATEIRVSKASALNKIWYYSPPGAASLATSCHVWQVTGANSGTSVASSLSPSWSGAAGSGWVSCSFTGVTLQPGIYKVSVFNSAGGSGAWSAKDAITAYWSTGAGSAGITYGPLYAPNLANASLAYVYNGNAGGNPPYSTGATEPGVSTFSQGSDVYPYLYVDGLAQNYWVDMEVTPVPVSGTGTASLSLFVSGTGTAVRSGTGTASLSLYASGTGHPGSRMISLDLLSATIAPANYGGTIE